MTEEVRYPVVVTITERYVVWYEGDSPKDAADRLYDDPEWYELLQKPCTDADYSTEAPDEWDYDGLVYSEALGPLNQCRTCGGKQYSARYGSVTHKRDCLTQTTD